MKKKLISGGILLVLLLPSIKAFQNQQDSFVGTTGNIGLRDSVDYLLTVAQEEIDSFPIDSYQKASRVRELALRTRMPRKGAIAAKLMGEAKINIEEFYEAKKFLSEALSYFNTVEADPLLAETYYLLGITNYYLGDYDNSIYQYQQAIQYFRKHNMQQEVANSLQNIGLVHHEINDLETATDYYKQALDINEQLGKLVNIAGLNQNLGIIYFRQANDTLALEYYQKSLQQFIELNDLEGIGSSYSNIGLIYLQNQDAINAEKNFQKSLEYFRQDNYKMGIMWAHHNIGLAKLKLSQFTAAKENILTSLEYAKKLNNSEGIHSNYQILSDLYSSLENYKVALEYYTKYTQIKDSLHSQETKNKIAELEALYNSETRERALTESISALKKEKTQKAAILSVLAIILAASVVIFFAYYQKRVAENNLAQNKKELEKLLDQQSKELEQQISERKVAEESDKLKSAFLANMSHELRTPMNAIIAFSNFLRDPNLSIERRNEYLDHITSAGDSLIGLIDDIIDIAKIEAKQLKLFIQPTNLTRLMIEIYKVFSEIKSRNGGSKLDFKLEIDTNVQYIINTDSQRLKQIISNLVDNAFKYTETGIIKFGFKEINGGIVLFVSDTGIGIPKDKQTLIFERFYQLNISASNRIGGTGLGLAICQNLVRMLGGEIQVESEERKGSTFRVFLPVLSVKKQTLPQSSKTGVEGLIYNQPKFNWQSKTILVAEDEELNYRVLDTCLNRTKATVVRAKDGIEAVNIFQSQKIDLVLMDIQMPNMDGYQAAREIKRINNRTPIIAQTSFAMSGEREKCLQAGCDDFVTKPIDLNDLLEKIEHFITQFT